MKPCKLKIGDTVTHKPDLYGMTVSTVTHIEKLFTNCERWARSESDLASLKVPYTCDGETLVIGEANADLANADIHSTDVYKWTGYTVITHNAKLNTIWSARSLKKI